MKKIFCFVIVAALMLALVLSASADTELKGNAKYDYTVSEDGKTAKVVVTLSDYYTANSVMMIPEYDSENLTMLYGDWLLRGAITVHWSDDTGDAVIAFSKSTDINTQVFEMMFSITGNASALDGVSCEVIAKTVEDQQVGDIGTSAPETTAAPPPPVYDPVEVIEPTTEPVTSETEPKETDPPVTTPPETEPVETEADVTVKSETEVPEETTAAVTDAEVTEPDTDGTEPIETAPDTDDVEEDKKPTVSYPGDYVTQDEYEKLHSKGENRGIVILVGVIGAVALAAVAVIIAVKKKSK